MKIKCCNKCGGKVKSSKKKYKLFYDYICKSCNHRMLSQEIIIKKYKVKQGIRDITFALLILTILFAFFNLVDYHWSKNNKTQSYESQNIQIEGVYE